MPRTSRVSDCGPSVRGGPRDRRAGTYGILFIDDRRHICEFWRRELKGEGYMVTVSSDADEAAQAIENGTPDLVITDVFLHGSDFATIRRALARRPEIPVVIYTALRDYGEEIHGVSVEAVIDKGGDLNVLTEAVTLVLRSRRRTRLETR